MLDSVEPANQPECESPDQQLRTHRTRDVGVVVFMVPAAALTVLCAWPGVGSVTALLLPFFGSAGIGLVSGWVWSALLLSLVRNGWGKTWAAAFVGAGVGAVSLFTTSLTIAAHGNAFDRSKNDMAELVMWVIPMFSIVLGGLGGFGLGGIAGWMLPGNVVRREAGGRR